MSEETGRGEPSNAQLLAAIQGLAATVDSRLGAVESRLEGVEARLSRVEGKLDQLSEDVMAVKVDTGFIDRHIADFQGWARRHEGDPDAHPRAA